MSIDEKLALRGKALEDQFFARQNEKLLERLHEMENERERKDALARVAGISDDSVLDHLLKLGLSAERIAALGLVPLVAVAWADGRLDEKERGAILQAAEASGIPQDSPARSLLEDWLASAPPADLLEAWEEYARALSAAVPAQAQAIRRDGLLARARSVAEAAGGFLGLGPKISTAEREVLDRLARAFA